MEAQLSKLIRAIGTRDSEDALQLLAASPVLAHEALDTGATRSAAKAFFFGDIGHYVYQGDTALHVAAASYDTRVMRKLLALGADVHAVNRRGAQPLHYASDGHPNSPCWKPRAQAAVIALLIAGGADPNARDKTGVTPLHRAVRTRCADAVRALLEGGADPVLKNGNGATPMDLALKATGRGGSGSPQAKAQQAAIIRLLNGDLK
ncbi:MAG: ankyrin repeat domain-containing protein [Alphaproteobacteria bacterium]|nr:ankyrin repeat domain-containing protein [Alphaproteobacteria bacterium]